MRQVYMIMASSLPSGCSYSSRCGVCTGRWSAEEGGSIPQCGLVFGAKSLVLISIFFISLVHQNRLKQKMPTCQSNF